MQASKAFFNITAQVLNSSEIPLADTTLSSFPFSCNKINIIDALWTRENMQRQESKVNRFHLVERVQE